LGSALAGLFSPLSLALARKGRLKMKCAAKECALKMTGKHKPWTVSVPVALLGRLAHRIRSLGVARSEYLRQLVRQDYQKVRAPKFEPKDG
jgi:hypothetical protein